MTTSRLSVAVPPEVADQVTVRAPAYADVVAWDGLDDPPATDLDIWVPPYGRGLDREQIAAGLRRLTSLQVVQLLSAGVEPWPGLLPAGTTLCSGRGIHGGSTAELAVALLLAAVRELPRYAEQQRRHEWRRHEPGSLAGRRVLVLGAGDIGTRVAEVLRPLGAEVTLAARRPREGVLALEAALQDLSRVEVLIVAVPLTDDTRHLVDDGLLRRLPDAALVVNVARGGIVDTDALTAELQAGRLRAALDVTDPEPLPSDHPLWDSPQVIITPHVGGGATGWEERGVDLVLDQLGRLKDGRQLRNVVDAGY